MSRAGISGVGVISALGDGAEATRSALFSPSPRLPEAPRRIATKLDLPVFEIPVPEMPEIPGLPLRFLLRALDEALADAELTRGELKNRRVGIAVGTTVACQLDNLDCHDRMRKGDFGDLSPVIPYVSDIPAEYLRRLLEVDGPALTVSNACSSGADALTIALEWLRTGRCDLVIAGGCDSVSKVTFNGFNALRVSSAKPCRPFDAERSGLNLGDAAAVVILEPPEQARKRGLKVEYELGGAGKTADGFHITQPESSGTELERAIRLALAQAELAPEAIDFVNAHGTGTPVNDRIESAVLARVFGDKLRYHSTKALTGHTLGAAGAIEAVFTRLMLEMRRAAPSFRYEHPSKEIPIPPLAEAAAIAGDAAVSTSLAFGGSNAALVLRKCRAAAPDAGLCEMYVSGFTLLPEGAPERDELVSLCRKYALRRPDRLTQMALAAAERLGADLAGNDTALLTVTSYGPASTTGGVLDDILDYPEEEILPTGFSHSVVNAAASYLGTAYHIHGPTFAVVGFEDPFCEAVDLAQVLLSARVCRRVLIVGADENSLNSQAAERLRKSGKPARGEGACALLLSSDPADNRRGALRASGKTADGVRLFPFGVPETLAEKLASATPETRIALDRLKPSRWEIF